MKWIAKKPVLILVRVLIVSLVALSAAQGQGGNTGGIMSFDPANQWILFTDYTGTWHAPLAIHSASAPSGSVTEFVVNTDDQFQIQTFHNSRVAALLDLDTNGSMALWGAEGGGIGTNVDTGETCIPADATSPCPAVALRIGANGILTQYRGQPTAGNGIAPILYFADATLTGSFGPYTIFTTNASGYASSGMYRLSGYITATSTQPGGSLQFVTGYTDETGSQTQVNGQPIPFGVVGANLPFSFVLYSEAGKPITIATVTTGGPTYTVHLRLEAL